MFSLTPVKDAIKTHKHKQHATTRAISFLRVRHGEHSIPEVRLVERSGVKLLKMSNDERLRVSRFVEHKARTQLLQAVMVRDWER